MATVPNFAPVPSEPASVPELAPVPSGPESVPALAPVPDKEWDELTEFQKKVYAYVRTIPNDESRSYKDVAEAIDCPRAYRAVGSALKKNPWPYTRCHNPPLPSDEYPDPELINPNYVACHRVGKRCGPYLGDDSVEGRKTKQRLRKAQV